MASAQPVSRGIHSPVMKVTLLKRSRTTCTTVPLAFGNFFVSFLKASEGMTANVVSTVARAMVPFRSAAFRALFVVGSPRLLLPDAELFSGVL